MVESASSILYIHSSHITVPSTLLYTLMITCWIVSFGMIEEIYLLKSNIFTLIPHQDGSTQKDVLVRMWENGNHCSYCW